MIRRVLKQKSDPDKGGKCKGGTLSWKRKVIRNGEHYSPVFVLGELYNYVWFCGKLLLHRLVIVHLYLRQISNHYWGPKQLNAINTLNILCSRLHPQRCRWFTIGAYSNTNWFWLWDIILLSVSETPVLELPLEQSSPICRAHNFVCNIVSVSFPWFFFYCSVFMCTLSHRHQQQQRVFYQFFGKLCGVIKTRPTE